MPRPIRALFYELSLRQILMGSLLLVYLAGIIYSLILLASLYQAKKDTASMRFTTALDQKQAELDSMFRSMERDVEHLTQLAVILSAQTPDRLLTQMDTALREVISGSHFYFTAYFAFERDFSQKFFQSPAMDITIAKDPKLFIHPTFNDPITFKRNVYVDPIYQNNPAEVWYHQALRSGKPVTSDFYFDKTYTQENMVSTTRAIRLESGKTIGVAGIDTLAVSMSDFLARVQIGKTGGLVLTDAEGNVIRETMSPNRAIFDQKALRESEGSRPKSPPPFSVDSDEFGSYRGHDGELYVTLARRLRSKPWSLVAYQSSREAYYVPVTHTMILIGLGVAFFTCFFWLGRQLAFVISGSVSNLVTNFNENSARLVDLEKGSKLSPALPKGPKEFQYLALKLNELYDRLSRSVTLLKQEATRAEKATEAKSRFLSVMSHEIRTPLNSMLGLTDVLGRTPLNAEQMKYLKVLQRSGENLLRILNDILDFSRLEAGKLEVDFHEFDLFDLISSVEQLKRLDAESKGIRLHVQAPDKNFVVLGDSTRLRQILLNLVGNAIKFTEKGDVTIRVSPLRNIEAPVQVFNFEVVDTGIGIPEKRIRSIFQEFSQADRSISRRFGGTGLGLTITQQLLSLFKSKLEVYSVEGKGSTFSFKLEIPVRSHFPAAYPSEQNHLPAELDPRPETKSSASPSESNTSEHRVLLVDDDEDNHRLMQAYMKFHPGIAVDHSYSGRDALQKIEKTRYSLVILDMQMPEMDGLEALRRIRKAEAESGSVKRVPVVILSANAHEEDQALSAEAGAEEHIAKPIKLDRFTALLSKYMPT